MLVSAQRNKRQRQKVTTTTKSTTKSPPPPGAINWVVYKTNRFLGDYRKALWLLFKVQIFISLQKKRENSNLQSTSDVYIWKEDGKASRGRIFLSVWLLEELVLLLNQALSISLHHCLKMCMFEVSRP